MRAGVFAAAIAFGLLVIGNLNNAEGACQSGTSCCEDPGAPPRIPPCGVSCILPEKACCSPGHCDCAQPDACCSNADCTGGQVCQTTDKPYKTCSCPSGQTLCGKTCIDTSNDFNNCGTCGNQCPQFAQCISGKCKCPPGFNNVCPLRGEKFCANTNTDPDFCGSCGNSCLKGQQVCCNGSCRDLDTTFCGTSCASAAPCPTPPPGGNEACCLGRCKDLNSNLLNCGVCTQRCSLGQKCVKGICAGKPVVCRPGQNCQTSRCVCPVKFPLCGPQGICAR